MFFAEMTPSVRNMVLMFFYRSTLRLIVRLENN